jgi:hypothetical protein
MQESAVTEKRPPLVANEANTEKKTSQIIQPDSGVDLAAQTENGSLPPYSILPNREKAFVIVAGSFAALISPLSSSIYLPALDSLSRDMNVSVSLINLTITTYLVIQVNTCNNIVTDRL